MSAVVQIALILHIATDAQRAPNLQTMAVIYIYIKCCADALVVQIAEVIKITMVVQMSYSCANCNGCADSSSCVDSSGFVDSKSCADSRSYEGVVGVQ